MKKIHSNTYFFVLDALRSDHVKYMPWLSSQLDNGIYIKNLKISSGFCERSEIFFSKPPSETNFVNAITLDIYNNSKKSPFFWLKEWMLYLIYYFEKNIFFQKIIRYLLWKLTSRLSEISMYPQRIPLNLLNKVTLTEDAIDFEEYSKSIKSGLLYHYISQGYCINWDYFTSLSKPTFGTDFSRLENLKNNLHKYTNSFIPIYISAPDVAGHQFGPHSKELIKSLENIDNEIKLFFDLCINFDKNSTICFIGDHGMESVKSGIDVDKIIKSISNELKIKPNKDFYYFLDSTMLRIWWNSKNQKKLADFSYKLSNNLVLKQNGYFGDEINIYEEGLPRIEEIADFVWWAKKGIQISPDFFHGKEKLKAGMHGYLKKDKISSGFFLLISNDILPKSYKSLDVSNLIDFYKSTKKSDVKIL